MTPTLAVWHVTGRLTCLLQFPPANGYTGRTSVSKPSYTLANSTGLASPLVSTPGELKTWKTFRVRPSILLYRDGAKLHFLLLFLRKFGICLLDYGKTSFADSIKVTVRDTV